MDLRTIAPQVALAMPPGALVEMLLIEPPPPHEDGYCTGCGGPSVRPATCVRPPCGAACPYCSPCECALKAEFGGMEDDDFDEEDDEEDDLDEEEDDFDDGAEDDDYFDEDDEDDEDDEEEEDDDGWGAEDDEDEDDLD